MTVFRLIPLLILLYPLMLAAVFIPGFFLGCNDREPGDIYYRDISPDEQWEAVYYSNNELFKILLQKNAGPYEESFSVETGASVFHKAKGKWLDHATYQWDSSDIGTITFTRKDGKWNVSPKELIKAINGIKNSETPHSQENKVLIKIR